MSNQGAGNKRSPSNISGVRGITPAQERAERALNDIRVALSRAPTGSRVDGMLRDYRFEKAVSGRRINNLVRWALFNDGAAAIYTTQREHFSRRHWLIVPDEGGIEYHHKPFPEGSSLRPLNLVGIGNIANHEIAREQFYFVAGAIAVEAATGWSNVIDLSTLRKRRA